MSVMSLILILCNLAWCNSDYAGVEDYFYAN